MNHILLLVSAIILLCIMLNFISSKIGVPMLLAFILLGMVFGSDGIFKIKCQKSISDINLPPNTLIVLVKKEGEDIVPNGQTVLECGDTIVLAAKSIDFEEYYNMTEIVLTKKMLSKGSTLSELSGELDGLVMLIIRGDEFIIPNGDTALLVGDTLVLNNGPI